MAERELDGRRASAGVPERGARSMPRIEEQRVRVRLVRGHGRGGQGRSQVSEARRGDEPVTGADVGPAKPVIMSKPPKSGWLRIIEGPWPHAVYSMSPKRGSRRMRRSQSASRRRAASISDPAITGSILTRGPELRGQGDARKRKEGDDVVSGLDFDGAVTAGCADEPLD